MDTSGANAVVITGCGLVSSLGLDVVNSCAAVRAGIVRATSMDVYPVRSSADGVSVGVVCHSVPILTEGFEGESRLIRLVQGGLEDLAMQCPDAPWKSRSTNFYLSIPSVHRLLKGAELVVDQDARKEMLEAAKEADNGAADMEAGARLLSQGGQYAGWSGQLHLKFCITSGNTGVAEALQQATNDLRNGACELAIVGGVDSYLDEDTLGWLEMTCRLKTPDFASGLPPGEAGCFLLLEKATVATTRGARVLAGVNAVFIREETKPLSSGEPSTGLALTELVHAAAINTTWGDQPPAWIIHDMNGEGYRANEWGIVLFRLASLSNELAKLIPWFPVASIGDVGAATGAVQACLAIEAAQRGYSPSGFVALTAASEGATRSCVSLSTGTPSST